MVVILKFTQCEMSIRDLLESLVDIHVGNGGGNDFLAFTKTVKVWKNKFDCFKKKKSHE